MEYQILYSELFDPNLESGFQTFSVHGKFTQASKIYNKFKIINALDTLLLHEIQISEYSTIYSKMQF